jgi:hypothetical protein
LAILDPPPPTQHSEGRARPRDAEDFITDNETREQSSEIDEGISQRYPTPRKCLQASFTLNKITSV